MTTSTPDPGGERAESSNPVEEAADPLRLASLAQGALPVASLAQGALPVATPAQGALPVATPAQGASPVAPLAQGALPVAPPAQGTFPMLTAAAEGEAQPLQPPASAPSQAERPHPLSPYVRSWIALVSVGVLLGRQILENPNSVKDLSKLGPLALVFLVIVVLQSVGGFIQWRTTRFVVDDHEVRIEHNFIRHTSDRIPFTKIQSVDVVQPFAARLLRLASVRIDVGAGRPHSIEFLPRARAQAMRDYLIARAHGDAVTTAHTDALPQADAWNDRAPTDRPVVVAHPRNLFITACLSGGFLWSLLLAIAFTVVTLYVADLSLATLTVALPMWLAAGGVITHHVFRQWNFTLYQSRKGVRITRGVTSLVSESIPVHRIQIIEIRQGLLWRPFGLYRVHLDVLGKAFSGGDGGEGAVTGNMLVPAGTATDVRNALGVIWPNVDLEAFEWQQVSRRGRWLRWIGIGTQQWAIDADIAATRGGVLVHKLTLIPHARVQSVQLKQGPLQRRLRLASVQLDSTPGPLQWRRRYLEPEVAREFALTELDRSRAARQRHAEQHALAQFAPPEFAPPGS